MPGLVAQVVVCVKATGSTTMPTLVARSAGTAASGRLSFSSTVVESTAVTDVISAIGLVSNDFGAVFQWLSEATTAAAFIGAPVWNVTSFRSLSVRARPSGEKVHD